ncbi:MAG: NAD(P)/FAD-dependent oxidoreductase [Clostridia bacterium]|nr:NAD(P)/FAD-dependent oxidoreductase [Clostridia bacterium]
MADILIIGAGVAGLSAGIFAAKDGHRVTICEKHSIAGGNLTGWQRGDYHIDNCIHWLTGTNPSSEFYDIWVETGALGNVNVYQPETLYTCLYEDKELSLPKDLDTLERDMLALSPEDAAETKALIKAIKTMQYFMRIGGKDFSEKIGVFNLIKNGPQVLKYHMMTTGQLAERFRHPLIKKFIVAVFGDKFTAMALLTVFATFCGKNGGLPEGGSLAMAKRMAKRFTDLGGEFMFKKEVVKINTEGNYAKSVTFADGTTVAADYVVIAADPAAIFGKAIDAPMPKILEKQYNSPDYIRFSAHHSAFAVKEEKLPFSADVVLDIPEKYRDLMRARSFMLREFSHEPSFAPAGENVFHTMTFIGEKASVDFINLSKDRTAYLEKKKQLAAATQDIIESDFPQLKGKLKLLDVWTPATYRRYTNAETGSFMSFILPPKKLPKIVPTIVKGFKNLLLATQWQQAPGGLPTTAASGRKAAEVIMKLEKKLGNVLAAGKVKKLSPVK